MRCAAARCASACRRGRRAVPSGMTWGLLGGGDGGGFAEEGEQLAVDLFGMGYTHDVRAACDLDVARVGKRGVQTAALSLDRQDPVGGAVQDQRRDVDPGNVLAEVLEPARGARPCRP